MTQDTTHRTDEIDPAAAGESGPALDDGVRTDARDEQLAAVAALDTYDSAGDARAAAEEQERAEAAAYDHDHDDDDEESGSDHAARAAVATDAAVTPETFGTPEVAVTPETSGIRDVAATPEANDAIEATEAIEADEAESRPGSVEMPAIADLWPAEHAQSLRERWRDVQLGFVDDPGAAAARAEELVAEAVQTLTAALVRQREDLAQWRVDDDGDTERLRVAVAGYHRFLDRVLTLESRPQ